MLRSDLVLVPASKPLPARRGIRSQAPDLGHGLEQRNGGLGVHLDGAGGAGGRVLALEPCHLLVVPFAQLFDRPVVHAATPFSAGLHATAQSFPPSARWAWAPWSG